MKETRLAYLAGFFDGEGCIFSYITRKNYPPTLGLQVTNTHPDVIYLFKEVFGGYIVKSVRAGPRKTAYIWYLKGQAAKNVLELFMPYLITKKEQARIGIELQSLVVSLGARLTDEQRSRRYELAAELAANKRINYA